MSTDGARYLGCRPSMLRACQKTTRPPSMTGRKTRPVAGSYRAPSLPMSSSDSPARYSQTRAAAGHSRGTADPGRSPSATREAAARSSPAARRFRSRRSASVGSGARQLSPSLQRKHHARYCPASWETRRTVPGPQSWRARRRVPGRSPSAAGHQESRARVTPQPGWRPPRAPECRSGAAASASCALRSRCRAGSPAPGRSA